MPPQALPSRARTLCPEPAGALSSASELPAWTGTDPRTRGAQSAPFPIRKLLPAAFVLVRAATVIENRLALRPACDLLISYLRLSNAFSLSLSQQWGLQLKHTVGTGDVHRSKVLIDN